MRSPGCCLACCSPLWSILSGLTVTPFPTVSYFAEVCHEVSSLPFTPSYTCVVGERLPFPWLLFWLCRRLRQEAGSRERGEPAAFSAFVVDQRRSLCAEGAGCWPALALSQLPGCVTLAVSKLIALMSLCDM